MTYNKFLGSQKMRNQDDLMWEQEFSLHFGPEEVQKLTEAANAHKNGIHDNDGGNPFRWSLLICIGAQCFEVPSYRDYHGFTLSYQEVKQWCADRLIFKDYVGDVDYITLFCGKYNEWVGLREESV